MSEALRAPASGASRALVVGGGVMGSGIAVVAARAGWDVRVQCRSAASVRPCEEKLAVAEQALEYVGLRGDWRDRVRVQSEPDGSEPDVIVEAVVEDLETKQALIARLQQRHPDAPVWSTTSTLPASELSAKAHRPDRVIVAHFANPPHLVPVVEVVPSPATADAVVRSCLDTLRSWGKRPAHLRREVRGFVWNRLQFAVFREAVALVRDGVIDPEGVETIMTHGYGLRMPAVGAFGMANITGLEMYAKVSDWLWPDLDDATNPDLVRDMLARDERFMGWCRDDVEAAEERLRDELLRRLASQR